MRRRRIVAFIATAGLLPVVAVISSVGAPPAHALGEPSMGTPFVVNPAVNNTVTNFKTSNGGIGGEPSVALNPNNTQEAVMLGGFAGWNGGGTAPLLQTTNGGQTWTQQSSIPPPPGIPQGCPCDQNPDFGRDGTLYGTFLSLSGTPKKFDVVSGSTTNAAQAASWQWRQGATPASTQLTDNAVPGNADQPWLLVNRDTTTAANDDAFVAWDDFTNTNSRVAVSLNSRPPNFARDNNAGSWSGQDNTNPGLRIAKDTSNGTMYAISQTAADGPNATAGVSPHNVTLHINRTTDTGQTWTLNGSGTGITKNIGNQDEGACPPDPAPPAPPNTCFDNYFGGVNALLGGVEHIAVNPTNHDVWVVYGQDQDGTGAQNNSIFVTRYTDNGAGTITEAAGFPKQIGTSTDAALPSIAVTTDGVIGILYTTFDGNLAPGGLPRFSAHLARSDDVGITFNDVVLKTFDSPQGPTNNKGDKQRVLGDYQQIKAEGTRLYGTFAGNRKAFDAAANSTIDPNFFMVPAPSADLGVTKTGSPSPVTAGTNLTYTIKVHNYGPNDALNVTTTDTLPANTTFVSASGDTGFSCTFTSPTVSCNTASISNGAEATITLVVHVSSAAASGSSISNTASASSGTPEPSPDPHSNSSTVGVNVITAADLGVTKTGPAQAPPGTSASYSIQVKNNGPSDAQTPQLQDPLPAGTTFVSITPPANWTCVTPAVGTNGTVTCNKSTSLVAGGTDGFSLTIHFNPTIPSGTLITNSATASSVTPDPGPTSNTGSANTLVKCDNVLTGHRSAAVTLNGGSWCVTGANLSGNMTIKPGTTVIMTNSTESGSVLASSPATVQICGNVIGGSVTVNGATGFALVGDPGDDACPGNTISGSVSMLNNTAGTEVAGNPQISGTVTVSGDSGNGPFLPDDNHPSIEGNTIHGSVSCSGDAPPPSNDGSPNNVHGSRTGQCTAV